MIHYLTPDGVAAPWVAEEVRYLKAKGVPIRLHAMRPPDADFFESDWAADIARETIVLYPLRRLGVAVDLLIAPVRFGGRFFSALWNAVCGEREHLRARVAGIAHLAVACHWASRLADSHVDLIHAHWIHSSGTVAMYGAWLLGVPFSFTGHAADLFRDRCALRDKIRRAEIIVCISQFHRRLYEDLGAGPEKLRLIHCGIDPDRFRCVPGGRRTTPPRILSLGRLVEKKGFEILVRACAVLVERGVVFECVIGGSGPLEEKLRSLAAELGVGDRVQVMGSTLLQEQLGAFLAQGAVFAQPSVWSRDRDVDGTPRTLMEAMATGLPTVVTRIAGLPEIVAEGETGFVVEPGDVVGLADALQELLEDETLAIRLGAAGRRWVEAGFRMSDNLERLRSLLDGYVSAPPLSRGQEAAIGA